MIFNVGAADRRPYIYNPTAQINDHLLEILPSKPHIFECVVFFFGEILFLVRKSRKTALPPVIIRPQRTKHQITNKTEVNLMKYVCDVCGWEYDEELGCPEKGIAPGTKWEDIPEDFECPLCFVGKDQFSEG